MMFKTTIAMAVTYTIAFEREYPASQSEQRVCPFGN